MKKVRVGVLGAGRGVDIYTNAKYCDCELVAICDNNDARIAENRDKLDENIAIYKDFDEFLNHDLDAVVIANTFHEHAPFVIKCFEKNIHVFCECISNGTMAEGVELARAFKKTKSIFMLAENYPFMRFNREMKKICDEGTLGQLLYAEGEYNHPVNPLDNYFRKRFVFFEKHWRNYLPRTYYVTHSLGPLMWMTGATPKKVTAFSIFSPIAEDKPTATHVGDNTSILTMQNDDGSVFKITGCAGLGGDEWNSYRVCGKNGQVENLRGMWNKIMLRYNKWSVPEGKEAINSYSPGWNDPQEDALEALKAYHGGSDFICFRTFINCVKEGKQPEHPFDLYSATVMASVGILAHRSVLDGGKPYDIPDFRNEEDCKLWENDRLTPFYGSDGSEPTLPCCSHTDYKPSEKQLELYREALRK